MTIDRKDPESAGFYVATAREHITKVFLLLNITQIGKSTCRYAANLIVVDIPEGVEYIGDFAFYGCRK